jgi:uncharacterized protein YdaU (DUF1376 family)
MAKLDFTRFDFYASRFLHSEAVEIMSAEEVGEYILLLAHAWMKQQEATLPNDPVMLAKYARVDKVSDLVLKQWQVRDDGRLFNPTLSEEWQAVVSRAEHGRIAAVKRWDKVPNGPASKSAKATHKVPCSQASPSQSVSTQAEAEPRSGGGTATSQFKGQPPDAILSLDLEGISRAEIERVYLYHWRYSKDAFWRSKYPVPTVALFRHSFTTLQEQAANWQPPAPKKVYDPACPKCHGKGDYDFLPNPDDPGSILVSIACSCWQAYQQARP